MQKYKEIKDTDLVKDSRQTINDNVQTLLSNNSGTAFPTDNLVEGMRCYRTDLKKAYTLTDAANKKWEADGAGVSEWATGKEYKKGSLVYHDTDVYLVLKDYTSGASPASDLSAKNLYAVNASTVSTSAEDVFMTNAEVDALFS